MRRKIAGFADHEIGKPAQNIFRDSQPGDSAGEATESERGRNARETPVRASLFFSK
jgi:hypothetical protein